MAATGAPDTEFRNSSGRSRAGRGSMGGTARPLNKRTVQTDFHVGGLMLRNGNRQMIVIAAAALVYGGALQARQHGDDKELVSKLSASRHTLADGIRQAEKVSGPAISA